jgi:hypothetical protein
MKDYVEEHENYRKLMWINAWSSVGGAIGVQDNKVATDWADEALKKFDERFPKIQHSYIQVEF